VDTFSDFDERARLNHPYRIREDVGRYAIRLVTKAEDARSAKVIAGPLDFGKPLNVLGIIFLPGLALNPVNAAISNKDQVHLILVVVAIIEHVVSF